MYTGEDSSSSSEEEYELDGGQEFHSERSASDPEYGPFFEGDMLNNPYERNGIPDDKYRWKLGKVKYFVDDAFTLKESEFIYKAVEDIQSNTCINFQEMTNDDDHIGVDHLFYMKSKYFCASYIGFQGGTQYLYLASHCVKSKHGNVLHETLHALGFYHEHCRMDRDTYVTINLKNVNASRKSNFEIKPSHDYGLPYDYGSIMHYGEYAFAIDKTVKTIIVKQPGAQIGQREAMSPTDIDKVDIMYMEECEARNA